MARAVSSARRSPSSGGEWRGVLGTGLSVERRQDVPALAMVDSGATGALFREARGSFGARKVEDFA